MNLLNINEFTDVSRLDSLAKIIENRIVGVGGSKDKTTHVTIEDVPDLTKAELTALYNNSDLCARVIDVPADLMTTNWINLELAESKEEGQVILDNLRDYETELDVVKSYNLAAKWAFLYGKSYIFLGINDGQPLHQPVDEKRIKNIQFLLVLDKDNVSPVSSLSKSIKPEYYQVVVGHNSIDKEIESQPISPFSYFLVHKSRLLIFDGISTPPISLSGFDYASKSKLQRFFPVYVEYYLAWSAIASMLVEYDVYIHSYQGLVELIAQNGEDKLRKHMEDLNLLRSALKMILIDGNFEDGKFLNRNVSGIDKVIEKLEQRLTLAADMPYMYFWGQVGRAGMGDSGDAERSIMQQKTLAYQTHMFRSNIKRTYRLFFLAKDGPTKGKEPNQWSFDFNPIVILNPVQEAEIRHKDALRAKVLIESQVITPGEARSLDRGNHYNSDITLHPSVKPIYEFINFSRQNQEPNENRNEEREYERKKQNIALGKTENLDEGKLIQKTGYMGARKIWINNYAFSVFHEPGAEIDGFKIAYPRSYLNKSVIVFGPALELPYCFVAGKEKEIIGFGFFDANFFRLALESEFHEFPNFIVKKLNEEIINGQDT